MTSLTAPLQGSDRSFGRFSQLVSKFAAAIRDGRRMMREYEELQRLPDSELRRMGIRREAIAQVVSARN